MMSDKEVYEAQVKAYEKARTLQTRDLKKKLQFLLADALPDNISILEMKQTVEQLAVIIQKVWGEHYPKEKPQ